MGAWMENPGHGIVLEALGNDPKGTGDPVHLLCHSEIALFPLFRCLCSLK